MKNQSSFIHGENLSNVPIYSVVSMCSSEADLSYKNGNLKATINCNMFIDL